jgi:hypothetical protein
MKSSLLSGLLSVAVVGAVEPLVDVGYSKYQGVSLENGVTQWLGVRYAAPPVGDLRFAAPQDPLKHKTTIVADTVSLTVFFFPQNSCCSTSLVPIALEPELQPPRSRLRTVSS